MRAAAVVLVAIVGPLTTIAAAQPPTAARERVGHGLSIDTPAGWRVSYRHFTPCIDPIERFSLLRGEALITLEERTGSGATAGMPKRPDHFRVSGRPVALECCALAGRPGWTIRFQDHGRAFYAYLYPSSTAPQMLLRILDSLRVRAYATL